MEWDEQAFPGTGTGPRYVGLCMERNVHASWRHAACRLGPDPGATHLHTCQRAMPIIMAQARQTHHTEQAKGAGKGPGVYRGKRESCTAARPPTLLGGLAHRWRGRTAAHLIVRHGPCLNRFPEFQVKLPKQLFEPALQSGNSALVERSQKQQASPGRGERHGRHATAHVSGTLHACGDP